MLAHELFQHLQRRAQRLQNVLNMDHSHASRRGTSYRSCGPDRHRHLGARRRRRIQKLIRMMVDRRCALIPNMRKR